MCTRKREQGFTLVEIMIVVAIIALLAVIAIPALLHQKMKANDAMAKSTLRVISTAAESYYTANGSYPTNEASLNMAYCAKSQNSGLLGYVYNCEMSSTGYTITATPVSVGHTGSTVETITTGGVLTP